MTAPGGFSTLRVAGLTDVGRTRHHNEDCFLLWNLSAAEAVQTERTVSFTDGQSVLMAVCDGMGGAAAGERASAIAVETLQDRAASMDRALLDSPSDFTEWLAGGVTEADGRILRTADGDGEMEGMGSTMTAVAVLPTGLTLGHVGDSRAYHLRDGVLRQISVDHSYVGELVALGRITPEEARTHEQRNLLLQVLGLGRPLDIDTVRVRLEPGDQILLCSDGLYDLVDDPELAAAMSDRSDPADVCRSCIDLANLRGGKDNITVVHARVE